MFTKLECYRLGLGYYSIENATPKEYKSAHYWFIRAYNKGSASAGFFLGRLYRDGNGVARDFLKAMEYFNSFYDEDIIDDGVKHFPADELFDIGNDFYYGKNGAPQDYERARIWFERSRSRGSARASFYLGMIHQYGDCGVKNLALAREYYEESALKGCETARKVLKELDQLNSKELVQMAEPFYRQQGPDCNYEMACKYYEWIIEKGIAGFRQGSPALLHFTRYLFNPGSEKFLLGVIYARAGLMYISPKHPKQDFDKGMQYLHKATLLECANAKTRLNSLTPNINSDSTTSVRMGMAYRNGSDYKGIPLEKNISFARLWFEKAAELGNTHSCWSLGLMYENGDNVEKNAVIAAQYYLKGKNLGDSLSSRYLDSLIRSGLVTESQLGIAPSPPCSVNAETDMLEKFRLAAANDHVKIKALLDSHPELLDVGCPFADEKLLQNCGIALGKTASYGTVVTAGGMAFPPTLTVSLPLAALLTSSSWIQAARGSRSRKGWTMLEFAAEAHATDVVEELIRRGAQITPLFMQLVYHARDNKSFFDKLNTLFRNSQSFAARCLAALKQKDEADARRARKKSKKIETKKQVAVLQFELDEKEQKVTEQMRELTLLYQEFEHLLDAACPMAGVMYENKGLFDKALHIPPDMAQKTGAEKIHYYLRSREVRDLAELDLSKIDNVDDLLIKIETKLESLKRIQEFSDEDIKKRATTLYAKFESAHTAVKQHMLSQTKPVAPPKKAPQTDMDTRDIKPTLSQAKQPPKSKEAVPTQAPAQATHVPPKPSAQKTRSMPSVTPKDASSDKDERDYSQGFYLYQHQDIETYLNASINKVPFDGHRTDRFRVHTLQPDAQHSLFLVDPCSNITSTDDFGFNENLEGIIVDKYNGTYPTTLINKYQYPTTAVLDMLKQCMNATSRQAVITLLKTAKESKEKAEFPTIQTVLDANPACDWPTLKSQLGLRYKQEVANGPNDLFDELYPCLSASPNIEIRILIPFNLKGSHWVLVELVLKKQTLNYEEDNAVKYTLTGYAHDPYGAGIMETKLADELHTSFEKRLYELSNGTISSIDRSFEQSPYNRRQDFGDTNACGVIVADDTMKRLRGESLNVESPYTLGAQHLREKQTMIINEYKKLQAARAAAQVPTANTTTQPPETIAAPETPTPQKETKSPPASSSGQVFFKPGPVPVQKQHTFGLLEIIEDYRDPNNDVIDCIGISIARNPALKVIVPTFYDDQILRNSISHELFSHPKKYKAAFELNIQEDIGYNDWCRKISKKSTRLTTLEIEAFCECYQIPCFLAMDQGGIYMGSQYRTPDMPIMLIAINDDDSYRALELPKGKDMAWLETQLQSDSVAVIDYETEDAPSNAL